MEVLYSCSRDINEHARLLHGWQQEYDQLGCGRFAGMLKDLRLEGARLFRERLNQAAMQHMRLPAQCATLVLPLRWAADRRDDLCANGLTLLPAVGEYRAFSPPGADLICLSLPLERFAVLGAAGARMPLPGRRAQMLELPPGHVRAAHARLLELFGFLHWRGALAFDPALEAALARQLFDCAAMLLEAAANQPVRELSAGTRRYVVERCHGLIAEHPGSPPTLTELCQRLQISRRSLQYSFQAVTGVAPLHYLRAVRLNAVRRALHAQPRARVIDLAAAQGFFHPAYFCRAYQSLFAERPTQTQRRARARGQ